MSDTIRAHLYRGVNAASNAEDERNRFGPPMVTVLVPDDAGGENARSGGDPKGIEQVLGALERQPRHV